MEKFRLNIINKSTVFLNGELLKKLSRPKSCRKIYSNEEYIVKVEWDDKYYMSQCKQENDLWKLIDRRDKKFFLPILYFKETKRYDVVIQPRIEMKMYKKKETFEKFWKQGVDRMVRKYKLDDLESCELKNWGIWNGKPVIFDYGI